MEKTLATLQAWYNSMRTGRAYEAMLYKTDGFRMGFQVEYYGSPVSLKCIAQISTPNGSSQDNPSLCVLEKLDNAAPRKIGRKLAQLQVRKQGCVVAHVYKYCPIPVTNILATTCQYEVEA